MSLFSELTDKCVINNFDLYQPTQYEKDRAGNQLSDRQDFLEYTIQQQPESQFAPIQDRFTSVNSYINSEERIKNSESTLKPDSSLGSIVSEQGGLANYRINHKTTNELRGVTNPKETYKGNVIAGTNIIGESTKQFEHVKADRPHLNGVRAFSKKNNIRQRPDIVYDATPAQTNFDIPNTGRNSIEDKGLINNLSGNVNYRQNLQHFSKEIPETSRTQLSEVSTIGNVSGYSLASIGQIDKPQSTLKEVNERQVFTGAPIYNGSSTYNYTAPDITSREQIEHSSYTGELSYMTQQPLLSMNAPEHNQRMSTNTASNNYQVNNITYNNQGNLTKPDLQNTNRQSVENSEYNGTVQGIYVNQANSREVSVPERNMRQITQLNQFTGEVNGISNKYMPTNVDINLTQRGSMEHEEGVGKANISNNISYVMQTEHSVPITNRVLSTVPMLGANINNTQGYINPAELQVPITNRVSSTVPMLGANINNTQGYINPEEIQVPLTNRQTTNNAHSSEVTGTQVYAPSSMSVEATNRDSMPENATNTNIGFSTLAQNGSELVNYNICSTKKEGALYGYSGNPGNNTEQISHRSAYMMQTTNKKKDHEQNKYQAPGSLPQIEFIKSNVDSKKHALINNTRSVLP